MGQAKTLLSVEQFAAMSFPDERVELSEGELIRMAPAGWEHGRVIVTISRILDSFAIAHDSGPVVAGEAGYRLSSHTLRAPDVSFVSKERLASVGRPEGFWQGAPDLAVEVVSPSDSASELRTKVEQFFRAGTRLVWLVFPTQRQVHVYSGPKQVTILDAHETLTGGDVLAGFSLKVEEFFR